MKLKIFLLFSFSLILLSKTSKLKTGQLFDLVNKDLGGNSHVRPKMNANNKSLFDFAGDKHQNKNNNFGKSNKNLFETLNFSQLKEKEKVSTKKANTSLFSSIQSQSQSQSQTNNANTNLEKSDSTAVSQKNTNTSNSSLTNSKSTTNNMTVNSKSKSRSKSKSEAKYQKNLAKNQKEIDKLKKKVTVLLQMNEKLMNKIKKSESSHNKSKKFNKNVVNFIQKYDSDVNTLKKNIESSKTLVENKITQKDMEFKKLYEDTNQQFGNLQNQIVDVGKKVNQIENEEEKKINQLHSNFSLKNLKVDDKLNVEGIAFINKVNAKGIDLGNIKLEPEQITFLNEKSKITVGKDSTSIGDVLNSVNAFRSLVAKCGENLEKCQPASEDLLKEQASKQEEILNRLKKLRNETTQILRKKHKKFR